MAKNDQPSSMRLDKFVAQASGLSRKQVHKLIRCAEVQVDGLVVRDTACKITLTQSVLLSDKPVCLRQPVYLMLNKPVGVICSTDDPIHETVIDLLPYELQQGVHAAGRLDLDTTGLVLLTDDGQWSHRITSPKRSCSKRYRVGLAEAMSLDECEQAATLFTQGVMLKGELKPTLPAELIFAVEQKPQQELQLVIQEGRYHQVKRMFAALGNRVVGLHREQIGAIELDSDLQPGQYRALTPEEIALF